MMKKALFALALLAATVCQAQFIGFVSQQSVTSLPFNAKTCTAALAAGPVIIPNIGQSAHFLTAISSSGITSLEYTLQGSYDGVTYFDISDPGTATGNVAGPTAGLTGITGSGYYPVVAATVEVCLPAASTITLRYSGISMTPGQALGIDQQGQIVKNIAVGAPSGTTAAGPIMRSPFGSSGGTIQLTYFGAAGPAGSSVQMSCGANQQNTSAVVFGPYPLAVTSGTPQFFSVPAIPCPWFLLAYIAGGASAGVYNLDISFTAAVQPADVCENYPKLSAPIIAPAGTTQVVPLSSTLSIYGCGYSMSETAIGTIQWEYGSGALCAGGTVVLSGPMTTLAGTPFTYSGPGAVMKAPIGNAVCIISTGGTVGGIYTYVLAP
jgi:hypothetical protein